jgi:hypothetical protein
VEKEYSERPSESVSSALVSGSIKPVVEKWITIAHMGIKK